MPGYYIRTAAGIVPVKDWYVRTASGIQRVKEAYVRTAAGIKKYWPAQPLTSAHSLIAGTSSSSVGYDNATGGPIFGSINPVLGGTFSIWGLIWSGSGLNTVFLYLGDAVTPPPDADSSFQKLDINGKFADSAGATVTRTITRAAAAFTNTSSLGVKNIRLWRWDPAAGLPQFISGNTYAVTLTRT